MSFQDPSEPQNRRQPNLVGKLIDVSLDQSNPMKSTITLEAEGKDNLGIYEGVYTFAMDNSKNMKERLQFAQKAHDEGGGFCGSIINQSMALKKGTKLQLEGVQLNGDTEGTTSWIKTYRHDRYRRPGIIHTIAESRPSVNPAEPPSKQAKVIGVSSIIGEAFAIDDGDRFEELMRRADHNFQRATLPRNTQNEKGQTILRNSMPITEAAFAAIDKSSGEVIDYTGFFDKKKVGSPDSSEYPEHYTREDRLTPQNKPVQLPRTGEDFKKLSQGYQGYLERTYPDRQLQAVCIESTRLVASQKVHGNAYMYAPADPGDKNPLPIQQIYQANQTRFRTDVAKPDSVTSGVWHPDIPIQFSPNAGATYNRYIRAEFEYLPPEYINRPWIASCSFEGKPLTLAPELNQPVSQAVLDRQGKPFNMDVTPAVDTLKQEPGQAEHDGSSATAPADVVAQSSQPAPPEKPAPSPAPADAAFDQSQALDQEAEEVNQAMAAHEQAAQPEQAAPQQAPAPASEGPKEPAKAPTPDPNSFDAFADQFAHTEQDCPFPD